MGREISENIRAMKFSKVLPFVLSGVIFFSQIKGNCFPGKDIYIPWITMLLSEKDITVFELPKDLSTF